jgi:hypothetical protein
MGTMPQGALRALQTTLRLTIGGVLLLGSVVHTTTTSSTRESQVSAGTVLGLLSTWMFPQRRNFVNVWKSFAFLSLRYKVDNAHFYSKGSQECNTPSPE